MKCFKYFKNHWQLYAMLAIPAILVLIFAYGPMAGLSMAFTNFRISTGLFNSEFVGFEHFQRFFSLPIFSSLLKNTVFLSLSTLIFSFPFPIILAFCLNEIKSSGIKRAVQLATYAPYFISTVVMVSLLFQWTDPRSGIINMFIKVFGGTPINFMGDQGWFRPVYILSNIWQFTGFNSIIYLVALSSVDPQLHEAAIIDGATRWKRVLHVDLPGIAPTVIIMLILSSGQLLNVGFEKVFLMQTPMNTAVSEIISTYVYKIGIQQQNFSFATAIGFFNSFINLIIIASVNFLAKRISDTSLW